MRTNIGKDIQTNARKAFSAELSLILALCRYRLDKSRAPDVLESLAGNVEWKAFIKLTRRHKLIPLIYSVIIEFKQLIPPERLREMEVLFDKNRKRMLLQTGELLKLNALLQKEAVPVVWVKGPALAERLFGDPTLRSSSDLDILVEFNRFDEADKLLCAEGYKPSLEWRQFTQSYFRKCRELTKHIQYWNEEKKISLEVHWRLATPASLYRFPEDEIFRQPTLVNIQGHPIPVLPPFANFIHLIVHGASHQWMCICWLMDIAAIMREDEQEWTQKLKEYAKDNHFTDRILDGIVLARYLLPGGHRVEKERIDGKSLERIIDRWEDPVFRQSEGRLSKPRHWFYMAGIKGGLGYKVQCVKNAYLDFYDIVLVKLPAPLFFLHYFLGPFLWLYRVHILKK